MNGSSPLARGLRERAGVVPEPVGIIPARAGFTGLGPSLCSSQSDHPRSRGVYPPLPSPWYPRGIIPARAGFTTAQPHATGSHADHPRSRGVYGRLPRGCAHRQGSSPLARGLRPERPSSVREPGIIPARAGFTPGVSSSARPARDHPRSRGVYNMGNGECLDGEGSSPLARGLPGLLHVGGHRAGIIPARAGFTRSTCRSRA